jgi:hypothetical protein
VRPTPLYRFIASSMNAATNALSAGNVEWHRRHIERVETLVRERFPSGSGFDAGTTLDVAATMDAKGERLFFVTSYHHMSVNGFYDGWTEHVVKVNPSLAFGYVLAIGGRNRNGIKDYMSDLFGVALDSVVSDSYLLEIDERNGYDVTSARVYLQSTKESI